MVVLSIAGSVHAGLCHYLLRRRMNGIEAQKPYFRAKRIDVRPAFGVLRNLP
jgi:hypothetical protein